ncbi:MAG TPA: hypothetical protein VGD59_12835 [Acidisarcina sp.]
MECAITTAGTRHAALLGRARLRDLMLHGSENERQSRVINRLLEQVIDKVTTSRWAQIGNCSQDTALRDILHLVEKGVLRRNPEGGRTTSYSLHLTP